MSREPGADELHFCSLVLEESVQKRRCVGLFLFVFGVLCSAADGRVSINWARSAVDCP
jgi:hypothetical protein